MKLKFTEEPHAYWLDGVRAKGVTTVAKIPDDTWNLDRWRDRNIAIGMALEPPLVERAAAHWQDRDKLEVIVEEALKAAKTHEAAGRGTAAHRITEAIDLGQKLIETPLAIAVRDAWRLALEQADLEIVPELCERIVVYPEQRICGKFDRIVRHRPTGRLQILDLKTGAGAAKYPHAIAVQLALYANAPLLAGPLDGRGVTEEFGPLPAELDRINGLVVHMPAEGTVEVLEVAIHSGWTCATQIVFPTLTWRKRSDLIRPISSVPVTEPLLLGAQQAPEGAPAGPERLQTSGGSENTIAPDPIRSASIRARLARIKAEALPEDTLALAKAWPRDVLSPKKAEGGWSLEHCELIEAVLTEVEGQAWMTPETDATPLAVETITAAFPGAGREGTDEGDIAPPKDIAALKQRIDELTDEQKAMVKRITSEANAAGYPLSLSILPSTRRLHIAEAILAAVTVLEEEDVIWAALRVVMGPGLMSLSDYLANPPGPSTLGTQFGRMAFKQAIRFSTLCGQYGTGALLDLSTGFPELVGPAVEAARAA